MRMLPVSSIFILQPAPICSLNSAVFGSRKGFSKPFTPILKKGDSVCLFTSLFTHGIFQDLTSSSINFYKGGLKSGHQVWLLSITTSTCHLRSSLQPCPVDFSLISLRNCAVAVPKIGVMLLHAPGGISPPSTTRWTKRRRLSFAFLERSAPRLTGSIRSARAEGKGSFAVLRQMKGSRIRRRKLDSRFRKAISSSSFPLACGCLPVAKVPMQARFCIPRSVAVAAR